MLKELSDGLLKLTGIANQSGINLPMVKDPKTGTGSVSVTLVFVSSVMVILGLVGKWSGRLGIVDIQNSLEFFYASCALYFGRNWKSKTKTKETDEMDEVDEDEELDIVETPPEE